MKEQEKQLLLADLCARLPYGVKITDGSNVIKANPLICIGVFVCDGKWKPYLRPMSSMTEEERDEYHSIQSDIWKPCGTQYYDNWRSIDWLNAHNFDFRNLIEKGLALEAPDGMNGKEGEQ